jgi:hypothetical protein
MTGLVAANAALAWIPFLEPMPASHRWWWLSIVPLALGVAMAWKAVRLASLEGYWAAVLRMTVEIVLAVVGIALGLFLLVQMLLPLLPAE